jgi:hypothetical protein
MFMPKNHRQQKPTVSRITLADPAKLVKASHLRYVRDDSLGFIRKRNRNGFRYFICKGGSFANLNICVVSSLSRSRPPGKMYGLVHGPIVTCRRQDGRKRTQTASLPPALARDKRSDDPRWGSSINCHQFDRRVYPDLLNNVL